MANEQSEARIAKLESQLQELKAHVQELKDEREIRELLSRYGYNADCGAAREQEWVDLFTEDGVMDINPGEPHGPREHIKQFSGPTHFDGNGMHMNGNNVVSHIRGNDAVVNSYYFVIYSDYFGMRLVTAANNQWTLKKINGKWLIKERRRRQPGTPEFITNLKATPT